MSISPFDHMQAAVDIVGTSQHPTNKIAATLAGTAPDGEPFFISRTNHWPQAIDERIGRETRIGNSSGTIHAETACIMDAPQTKGASIFVTDPPCPNCMKNVAEAGIAHLYIDHKGFGKDFAKRRGDAFESMSMRIAEKAGISVSVIYRKEQIIQPFLEISESYTPPIESPPEITDASTSFDALIKNAHAQHPDEPFALAFARNAAGERYSLLTARHPTVGYTSDTIEKKQDKYSFILQPVSRILMIAAKHGLKIEPEHFYSSRIPTSRELVNIIGGGIDKIQIGDINASRDEHGPKALKQLESAELLEISQP